MKKILFVLACLLTLQVLQAQNTFTFPVEYGKKDSLPPAIPHKNLLYQADSANTFISGRLFKMTGIWVDSTTTKNPLVFEGFSYTDVKDIPSLELQKLHVFFADTNNFKTIAPKNFCVFAPEIGLELTLKDSTTITYLIALGGCPTIDSYTNQLPLNTTEVQFFKQLEKTVFQSNTAFLLPFIQTPKAIFNCDGLFKFPFNYY